MISIKRTDLNKLVLERAATVSGERKKPAKKKAAPVQNEQVIVVEENADAMKDLVKAIQGIVPQPGIGKEDLKGLAAAIQGSQAEALDKEELRNIFLAIEHTHATQSRLLEAIERSTSQEPADNSGLLIGVADAVRSVQETQERLIDILQTVTMNPIMPDFSGLMPDFSEIVSSFEQVQSTQLKLLEAIGNTQNPEPAPKEWEFMVERDNNGAIKKIFAQGA